ncbi:MAG: hypothetical protein A2Y93_01255 [Chloroflexi bacterium RBG_13_68_17]|jgi:hypothetical protein|nr:MAG: hypothetical protein A2Y93_01255 [Chloroflexi bacterium RBG_13_68_17]
MSDDCCGVGKAGSSVCELPAAQPRAEREGLPCPECGQAGKPVEGQTVRALVAVSLREVPQGDYLFCRTRDCPVVYFGEKRQAVFVKAQVRERVYQKEPDSPDVWICYCFRHSVGEVTVGRREERDRIVAHISAGIKADECACDLRNPQGSCCLGNVNARIKQVAGELSPASPAP